MTLIMKTKTERKRSRKPGWQQEIASERMEILLALAGKEFKKHPERSDRYAALARRIGMRYNVSVPKGSGRICKGCQKFMVPGENCVVRTSARTRAVETRCTSCGKVSRHPYAREKAR